MFVSGVMKRSARNGAFASTLPIALAIVVAILALTLSALKSDPRHQVSTDLDAIIDNGPHANAFWGVYVRDLGSGRVLYERNADTPLVPASNQKLVTAAAALIALGADFRFETPLLHSGEIVDGTLKGDLIIAGSGDPTFGSRANAFSARDPFDVWTDALRSLGVSRIEGRIIGDDNVLDDDAYADGWDINHIGRYGFAAPVGGLIYRDNIVNVVVDAHTAGRPPRVTSEPDGYLEIDNRVQTSSRRWSRRLDVNRPFATERLALNGLVSTRFRTKLDVPVSDPTRFALETFRMRLEASGIEVTSNLVDVDDLADVPRYRSVDTLGVVRSEPLATILERINKESDNLYADAVFRAFGWGGSASGGERRVRSTFEELGIDPTGLSVRDGSGLSRKDLITPRQLGELLVLMRQHSEGAAFSRSLAQGGEQQTTLERRLSSYDVWAKTGSLEYVRTLSGYIRTRDDRMLAFTILVNNYPTSSARVRRAIDEIVSALANSTG